MNCDFTFERKLFVRYSRVLLF